MTNSKNSLKASSSSDLVGEVGLVKKHEEHPKAQTWIALMLRVRKELLNPNKSPARRKELLEIRAKLVIMGPDFLDAGADRLQAMFDRTTY